MREMKDSGIEWIGEIPAGWKVSKVKHFIKCLDGRRKPIDASLRKSGIYPYWGAGSIVDYIDEYLFDEEVILLGEDGAPFFDYTRPVSFLVNEKVWVNNHIHVLKPDSKNVDSVFLVYWLNNVDYKTYINGSILCKLTQSNMNNIAVAVPPLADQHRISTYLDTKCEKIDSIIARQQEVIEKLKAYKLSVITEAVTKGLNPDVRMKDSGVEWIGDVPEHWELIRLKFLLANIVDCPHETPNYSFEAKYHVIRTADQELGSLRSDDNMYRLDEEEYQKRIRRLSLDKDDIVYGREGERWGLACIVPESDKYCLGQRMMQFRCNTKLIIPKFAMWALNSKYVYLQGSVDTIGSTSPHVNISTMRNYFIPTPPMEEQSEIMNYLDKKCSAIDSAIAKKQAIIEKLTAYKKSLIYEVVTGKREV